MTHIDYAVADGTLTVSIKDKIDTRNAHEVEDEITQARKETSATSVVLDCNDCSFISSAGLRVILRLEKACPGTKIVGVIPEVYEVLDITGFTEIVDVQRAYRVLSVDDCEVIGQGANGKVYRFSDDIVVKVYFNPEALPEIHRERELARTAFVLGIPTAIPYDVVRVGDGYGSVFELLNATSFAKLLIKDEKPLDEVVAMSVDLLKLIHGTEVDPSTMPSMKDTALDWAGFLKDHLPEELAEKLYALVDAVPEDHHMMHGDYHIKNVMLQNGEVLLIDMDTLCYGHPIFELGSMFNAYKGFSALDHSVVEGFIGIPYETAAEFWEKSLLLYLDGADDEKVREVEEKASIVGFARLMRRAIRRGALDSPEGRAGVEYYRTRLGELLPKWDTLLF